MDSHGTDRESPQGNRWKDALAHGSSRAFLNTVRQEDEA